MLDFFIGIKFEYPLVFLVLILYLICVRWVVGAKKYLAIYFSQNYYPNGLREGQTEAVKEVPLIWGRFLKISYSNYFSFKVKLRPFG